MGAFAQGQGEEPLAGEDRQSADTPDAGTPPPTLLTGTAEGSGPFADGAYLTPEELADPDAWDADDEELSLAGTAAAAEMVDPQGSDESAWDDDWDDETARHDRSVSEFASDNDASDNDASDDDEATLDEDYNDDESSPVTVAAASAQLPRGTLVATSSWASIVTTTGLCLAVIAGIWQLLALAAGASSHLSGGHYDVFHRIGSGLTATGPTQALVLLVASVLVSIPSFLGDRNARAFDDAAATALGVCGASALVAAVGAVLTFRYGAHVADLTTGDLSTTQLLRLLTDLMATAGIALSAFATTVMALRTRR